MGLKAVTIENHRLDMEHEPFKKDSEKEKVLYSASVEEPLRVIIPNKHQGYENGRSGTNSYEEMSAISILQEGFTKNALQVVHGLVDHPSATPSSSCSTRVHSVTGRHEEVSKRRNIVDKIDKLRESRKLEMFIPQCDQLSSTQMAMLIRRIGKKTPAALPEAMRQYVMEEAVEKEALLEEKKEQGPFDPDHTDYSDDDWPERPTLSGCTLDAMRMAIGSADLRIVQMMEDLQEEYDHITADLRNMLRPEDVETDAESCARMRPIPESCVRRHDMHSLPVGGSIDYSRMMPSTSRECSISEMPMKYKSAVYLQRLAMMPPMILRKNPSKMPWLNSREIDEEKLRNGWRAREERERRLKRKKEKGEEGLSDSYEDTDDTDDEYLPIDSISKTRINGKKHKDHRRRKKRGRPCLREGMNPPLPLTKLGRRTSSVSTQNRPIMPRSIDMDDIVLDSPTISLPPKIEYKEIWIPTWRELDDLEYKELHSMPNGEEKQVEEEEADEALIIRIAREHHILEHEERRRFQAFRDAQTSSGLGVSPVEEVVAREIPLPPFDPLLVCPRRERQSTVPPWSPSSLSQPSHWQ